MDIIRPTPLDRSDFVANVPTYMAADSLHNFARGFLEIAETSASMAAQNQSSIDHVIPAILYCVRHSVELYLKSMLYRIGVVEWAPPPRGDVMGRHGVGNIFDKHKADLEVALGHEPETGFRWREWVDRLEVIVRAVDRLDPDGQSVRYPADRELAPNQSGGYAISTRHLAVCIAEIRHVYDAFDQRDC